MVSLSVQDSDEEDNWIEGLQERFAAARAGGSAAPSSRSRSTASFEGAVSDIVIVETTTDRQTMMFILYYLVLDIR